MEQRGVGLTVVGAVLIVAAVIGVIWLAGHLNQGTAQNRR
jgi:hypothetical protein